MHDCKGIKGFRTQHRLQKIWPPKPHMTFKLFSFIEMYILASTFILHNFFYKSTIFFVQSHRLCINILEQSLLLTCDDVSPRCWYADHMQGSLQMSCVYRLWHDTYMYNYQLIRSRLLILSRGALLWLLQLAGCLTKQSTK